MMRCGWFLICVFLMLGCAGMPDKKESVLGVGISNTSDGEIRRSLVGYVSQEGFELVDSDRRTLSFDKPADKWTAIRYASFVNPETFLRMRIFIMEVGASDFWIGFEPLIVTERGSGFEKKDSFKGQAIQEMQSILENWKSNFVKNSIDFENEKRRL